MRGEDDYIVRTPEARPLVMLWLLPRTILWCWLVLQLTVAGLVVQRAAPALLPRPLGPNLAKHG